MNPRELKALETATQAAPPLPASRHEDCEACRRKLLLEAEDLELTEMRLQADLCGPSRMRKSSEVSKVLDILDSLGKDGNK
jgi:hypothetical protein